MPLYEYRCEKCENRVELIQKFSDPPLTECSKCKGKLSKVIAAPALQFKGTGWYVTDYSDKGKPPKSETESKPDSKSESKGKTDNKPVPSSTTESSSDSKKSSPPKK